MLNREDKYIMKNNNLKEIFFQLDEVRNLLRFKKKGLIEPIKTSLTNFENECTQFHQNFNTQKEKFNKIETQLTQEIDTLNVVKNKYDLVSSFLEANPPENQAMTNFKHLITHDFIDFANSDASLKEEAKALSLLEDVKKRLQEIVTFPSIYNKNIVAVGGGFSAGKSEFINSFFIDKELKLPVGINLMEAIPTYITVAEESSIKGFSYKGGVVELSVKLYKELSHDTINSLGFKLKDIAPVMSIETAMESCENICFIDTPSYNLKDNKERSKKYFKHANTLLWTIDIDVNGTVPDSDLKFLKSLALDDKKLYIIANKADLRTPEKIKNILDRCKETLTEHTIEYEGISAFSSLNKKEFEYRGSSLFEFLETVNTPINLQTNILDELKEVFNMYKTAIKEQILWVLKIHSHLKSLESDMDSKENQKTNEQIENLREMFNHNSLVEQLKKLETLEEVMLLLAKDIFTSLELRS